MPSSPMDSPSAHACKVDSTMEGPLGLHSAPLVFFALQRLLGLPCASPSLSCASLAPPYTPCACFGLSCTRKTGFLPQLCQPSPIPPGVCHLSAYSAGHPQFRRHPAEMLADSPQRTGRRMAPQGTRLTANHTLHLCSQCIHLVGRVQALCARPIPLPSTHTLYFYATIPVAVKRLEHLAQHLIPRCFIPGCTFCQDPHRCGLPGWSTSLLHLSKAHLKT
jgi:hypothetical protein